MKTREPWLGLAGAAGIVMMLVGDGLLDVVGFFVAALPYAYGLAALLRHRNET